MARRRRASRTEERIVQLHACLFLQLLNLLLGELRLYLVLQFLPDILKRFRLHLVYADDVIAELRFIATNRR
jgi:hypothetical protein